jgi:hypothetical protein
MAIAHHSLSRFLQHSGDLFAEIEDGEVLLKRRDGPDLAIMTFAQATALANTLRVLVAPDNAISVLPWLSYLGSEGIDACLNELREVGPAAAATGELRRLEETLHQWYATALACWDERLLGRRADYKEYLAEDSTELPRPK